MGKIRSTFLGSICLLLSVFAAPASVLYVDINSTNPTPPFAGWSTASTDIQSAIDAANPGDQILVNDGNYTTGARVVYGSTNIVAINKPVTVQSVNGPSVTWIWGAPYHYYFQGQYGERCVYATNGAALIGFTVLNGQSANTGDPNKDQSGAGIWCESTSVTISNCVIFDCFAVSSGGGVVNGTLLNCTINNNSTWGSGGGVNGGILYNCALSGNSAANQKGINGADGGGALNSTLFNCTLSGNQAFTGAGAYNCTLTNCLVISNSTASSLDYHWFPLGGGLYSCTATFCKIIGNFSVGLQAGGAYGSTLNDCLVTGNSPDAAVSATLNNCTVTENSSGYGAIDACTAYNSIVYNNGVTNDYNSTLYYCCTYPLPTNGVANFTNAPMFFNITNEFHLLPGSPCIDAGNNSYVNTATDLDGNPRVVGSSVDVGAYEYQDLPIFVIAQPSNQTNAIGQSVTFNIEATGQPTLNYQWQLDGTNIAGATNSSLTLSNIQLSQAGAYTVTLSNSLAVLTSSNAFLVVVYPPPVVQAQSGGLTLFAGATAAFSASVLTYSPTSYQWYLNGTPLVDDGRIVGSTSTNLTIANVGTNDTGAYELIATNTSGSATSTPANLSVLPVTTVVVQPQNLITNGGANITFASTITGQGPFTYQWQFGGTNLLGATNSTLALTNVLDSQSGAYSLLVGNAAGTVASSNTMLTVVPSVTAFIQPGTVVSSSGKTIWFSLSSGGLLTNAVYQWQFNGTNLPASWVVTNVNSIVYLSNPDLANAGPYDVVASDAFATITSSVAVLTVIPLAITTQPSNQSVLGGANVNIGVTAYGEPPLSYQWQYNGVNIANATNSSISLTNVLVSQSGLYSVIVTNAYGLIVSSNANLTVTALAITLQPTNGVAWPGGTNGFKVFVSGQPPFTFDWQFNGADIPVTTSNLLSLTNLQTTQFGTYDVIVSNAYGSVTSSNVQLFLSEIAVWGNGVSLVSGLTNILAIAGGQSGPDECFAVRRDSTAVHWPATNYIVVSNVVAVAAPIENYAMLLRQNGQAYRWLPADDFLAPEFSPTNLAAMTTFSSSSVALMLGTNGVVNQVGFDGYSILTNVVAVAVAQGYQHSLALTPNGQVLAWGDNSFHQTNVPPGLSNVVAIAAGYYHSLALRSDGRVVAWGDNNFGQTNVPVSLSNIVAIAAGQYHSLALKSNGTIVAWGYNAYGQTSIPANLSNVVAIAAGQYHSMALVAVGTRTNPILSRPVIANGGFNVSLPSQSGRVYALQYKNKLSDTNWASLPLAPGNGGTLNISDATATNSQRFYRVQQW